MYALVSDVSALVPVRLADVKKKISIVPANVTDSSAMRRIALEIRPDFVFHLAAFTHVGKSFDRVEECIETNTQGTVNLLLAMETVGYESFIYAGTSEIYGDIDVPFREDAAVRPISPYSLTKYAGERFCQVFNQAYGWPVVCLRPFNAFGPGQSPDRIIPEIITTALRGDEIAMTTGRQTREFNFVTDIARGFVLAAAAGKSAHGEIINIGCGVERSIADVARSVLAAMGDPVTARFGAIPDRPTEIWRMFSDSTKAEAILGWLPQVEFDEGLTRTIAWYRSEYEKPDSAFIP